MIQALKTVLPIKKKERIQHKRKVKLLLNEEEGKKQLDIYLHKNQKARARLLAGLLDQPQQDYELITKKLNVTLSVIRSLEEQGVLRFRKKRISVIRYTTRKKISVHLHIHQNNSRQSTHSGKITVRDITEHICFMA